MTASPLKDILLRLGRVSSVPKADFIVVHVAYWRVIELARHSLVTLARMIGLQSKQSERRPNNE
jgi:hypothetical protein